MQREHCIHPFDNGFLPKRSEHRDAIIVTHCSPLISAVSRTRPGEYRICGGSFIGGGGSTEAPAEEAAEYLSWSPHWAHLMRLTKELGIGLGRRAPSFSDKMKRGGSLLFWTTEHRNSAEQERTGVRV